MRTLEVAYQNCDAMLRAQDRDRWLAAFFVPVAARGHIQALYAFNLEIARVREMVREPLNGEIRLQWWRDVLEGMGRGEVQAHPVAAALLDILQKFNLPKLALLNLIEARVFDLYDDAMPSQNDLEGYCGETCSILFQLAAMVLGAREGDVAEAAGHAGVAYAMTGLMLALPLHIQRGQCYLPPEPLALHGLTRDDLARTETEPKLRALLSDLSHIAQTHLQKAKTAIHSLPKATQTAFLPLAVVPLHLAGIAKNAHPARDIVQVAQWRKQWALWRAARAIYSPGAQ